MKRQDGILGAVEMFAPRWHSDREERIVAIEYQRARKTGWKPFAVLTESSSYDFEWCGKDGVLAAHMSGGGRNDTYMLHGYCDASKLCGKLWYDHERIKLVSADEKPLADKDARPLGVLVIAAPLDGNPFDDPDLVEDDTVYCQQCRDRHPSESMCDHVQWEDGSGWTLGCGAEEIDFGATQASLYRLLRMLSPADVRQMRVLTANGAAPAGDRSYYRDLLEQRRGEERFWPAIAWLKSLDHKCRAALALTAGWVWMFERVGWRACQAISSHPFYRHLSSGQLNNWLALDPLNPHVLDECPMHMPLGFKNASANDRVFQEDPFACEEVTLWPPQKTMKTDRRELTLSVAEVKWGSPRHKSVDLYFGAVINRNGKHVSELAELSHG